MPSSLVALMAITYGLIFALWGYPIFRVMLPIYGGILGYALGVALVVPDYPLGAFLLALALAIVFASVAYFYWSFMIGLAGALLGYGLVAGLVYFLSPKAPAIAWLIGLAGALIGFLIFLAAKDLMVMVASALNGAMIVGGATHSWLYPVSTIRDYITLVIFTAVAVIGVVVQVRLFGKERKYSTGTSRKISVK
jgi:xanthosine utilization system XapX-like protein